MRKMKGLLCAALAAVLAAGSIIPSFAAVTYSRVGSNGVTYVKTNNAEKYSNYPAWIWWHGYCYYYENPVSYLKNTVTPDGYTVDEYGRWTENGVAVHNGFGSVKVGTDEYLGKSSDEIWSLMKDNLKGVFENSLTLCTNSDQYAYGYDTDIIWNDHDAKLSGYETYVQHNNPGYNTFITASIGNEWSDMAENGVNSMQMAVYAAKPDMKEKTIKAVIGDNIGTELFNYIKQHADKRGSGYTTSLDANGNEIKGNWKFSLDANGNGTEWFEEDPNGSAIKTEWTDYLGDGINARDIDLSAWQNRTTDYGKTFSVVKSGNKLLIHVYN